MARIRNMSCRKCSDDSSNFERLFDFNSKRLLILVMLTLMAACSPPNFWSTEKNQELIAFEEHIGSCRASVCQTAFPVNQRCMEALEMIRQGRPKVENQDQYVRYLQGRILFSDAYADWLEGEAGKSVMARQYCKKNLEFIGHSMNVGVDDD